MIAAALLLLAAQPSPAVPPPSASTPAAPFLFAPPLGRPMIYRVTTRRLARDGTLASYTLVYALRWERVGRGVQLIATLGGIESDARPEMARALTRMLQPLVGQAITYLVAPDGSSIDLVDPEALWQRVLGDMENAGAKAAQGEAKQMAGLLAALPPAERDRLATADIRALVAPANPALFAAADGAPGLSVKQDGNLRTVAKVEKTAVGAGAAQPLEIDVNWTVDTTTGLVLREQRQSWVGAAATGDRRLVEERIRALAPADPD